MRFAVYVHTCVIVHFLVFKWLVNVHIRLHLLILKWITALIMLTKVKHILFIHCNFKYLNWKILFKKWAINFEKWMKEVSSRYLQRDLPGWAPLAMGQLSTQTQSFILDRLSKLASFLLPSIVYPN